MGFSEGKIVVDSPNDAYYSGQLVSGAVEFTQNSIKSMRGIFIKFKGVAKAQWRTGKTNHYGREEYIHQKVYIMGSENGDCEILPAAYKLPFHFVIPEQAPPSFECAFGYIRYKLKAGMDLPLQMDPVIKKQIAVFNPVDLNLIPECLSPVVLRVQDRYWGCCGLGGEAEVVARLPRGGYSPGQTVPLHVHCDNASSVNIAHIKIAIKKALVLRSGSGTVDWTTTTKHDARVNVARLRLGPVPPRSSRDWTAEMMIPPNLDTTSLHNCRIIDLDFIFKIHIFAGDFRKGNCGEKKLYIGAIPIVGTEGVTITCDAAGDGGHVMPPPPPPASAPLLHYDTLVPPPECQAVAVPSCKSNYDSAVKINGSVTAFAFSKDEELKVKWMRAILRSDWTPSTSSVVCYNL